MIKVYLKQAWELLKQNKLFSTLYIVGTGLSIAMTMVIAIVFYVRLASVYPESNRSRTLVIKSAKMTKADNNNSSNISYKLLNDWLYPLKDAEAVTGILDDYAENPSYVQLGEENGEVQAIVKYTDGNFFKVFPFIFLEGKPFTEADLHSGIRNAVLTDSYARQIFGTSEGVVGKTISLDFADVRVVGVVKGGSFLTPASYGQIYLPYTCVDGYDKTWGTWALGAFEAYILVKTQEEAQKVQYDVNELMRKYNSSEAGKVWKLDLVGQPESHWRNTFRVYSNVGVDWNSVIWSFIGVFMVLLFVPALNLSGMISARMERRLPEMGVRKAFGANRSLLLKQIVWENLLLSGLGALLGLVIAWIALVISGQNTFSLFETFPRDVPGNADVWLGVDMLFAPLVFVIAVAFCLLLNMLSALIPAWYSLRRPIVSSLNEQK